MLALESFISSLFHNGVGRRASQILWNPPRWYLRVVHFLLMVLLLSFLFISRCMSICKDITAAHSRLSLCQVHLPPLISSSIQKGRSVIAFGPWKIPCLLFFSTARFPTSFLDQSLLAMHSIRQSLSLSGRLLHQMARHLRAPSRYSLVDCRRVVGPGIIDRL